jgi:hypothetical protein
MRCLANVLVVITLLLVSAACECGETPSKDIQILLKQGRGSAAGRAAWDRVANSGPEILPSLLDAMDTGDTIAANWLRTAFDAIVDREMKNGGRGIDAGALLAFVNDAKRQGRVRRLALDVLDRLRPGTSAKLYPGWLDDPEFRYEAVALTLDEGKKLVKAGQGDPALKIYRKAFEASRDVAQARAAAAGLQGLGVTVSVGKHLGFLMDWHLVGPFDGQGQKGFTLIYPPERGVDLGAEYDGQSGKVRWKSYKVTEPPPTFGARHQALVNLREKDALGDADDAVAFAYTEIAVAAAQQVEFRGAADDNFIVYVNGARVFGFEEWRNGVRHDRHRFAVNLRAGKNAILVKIGQSAAPNPEPNWEFFLRVVDATGKGIVFASLPTDKQK